jgi:nicotinate-nucleotide--dimethylbenzimidazole phosphoribosyltransferase
MKKLKNTISEIEDVDKESFVITQKRLDNLTKPKGSLGRLEELAKQIVAITGKENPILKNKIIFTLAADHGITEEGVSAYPKEVTSQMVYNFLRGGAGINVLARHTGCKVVVCDMGVATELRVERGELRNKDCKFVNKKINYGTKNFVKESAMTKEEAIRAIEKGIELVEEELNEGIDIIGTGDMGIGNTTTSSAICAVICRKEVEEVTGRGTGIDDRIYQNKIKVIKKAIEFHKPNPDDAIDILSKIGGYEIAGIAGVILGGARYRIPVVIDGFISGAGALIAYKLNPKIKDYLIASHLSKERGHRIMLEYLGLNPVLNLDMRLGEGTGSCLAISIIEASCKILLEMATFSEAGVSEK